MEFNFAEKVNILGQDYKIEVKKRCEDPLFAGFHEGSFGVTDFIRKRILLRDRKEDAEVKSVGEEFIIQWTKKTLRHEIVHAFLNESGLDCSTKGGGPWARNEEMVDWMAWQGPKLVKAWTDAGAL